VVKKVNIADAMIAEQRGESTHGLPNDMPQWMRRVILAVDGFSWWCGHIICFITLPLIAAMVIEIFMRYLFVAPTVWAFDVSRMLYGAMFMLGRRLCAVEGRHIRADFLYRLWSVRVQASVDLGLYLVLYFPSMIVFLWFAFEFTEASMAAQRARHGHRVDAVSRADQDGDPGRHRTAPDPGHLRGAQVLVRHLTWEVADMSPEIIGVWLIACLLLAIFAGFPISFTLIFLGLVFGYAGFGDVVFYLLTFQFYGTMMEQTLAAVPLFVFMGLLMEQAGLMERLFEAIQKMLSRVRGALYLAVLFVSTIFAAATGVVGASVTLLGIMAAKTMGRAKYDVRLSAGTIAAGGTLGILIPPSILLIVLGPVLEVPVTDLFAAAIIPGLMLAVIFAIYTTVRCWLNPSLGPVLPLEDRSNDYAGLLKEFVLGLVPPAALVFAALGSIVFGIATPTRVRLAVQSAP
jgi:TRAP-type C4-dicarboxylate transport system permease small subunit